MIQCISIALIFSSLSNFAYGSCAGMHSGQLENAQKQFQELKDFRFSYQAALASWKRTGRKKGTSEDSALEQTWNNFLSSERNLLPTAKRIGAEIYAKKQMQKVQFTLVTGEVAEGVLQRFMDPKPDWASDMEDWEWEVQDGMNFVVKTEPNGTWAFSIFDVEWASLQNLLSSR